MTSDSVFSHPERSIIVVGIMPGVIDLGIISGSTMVIRTIVTALLMGGFVRARTVLASLC